MTEGYVQRLVRLRFTTGSRAWKCDPELRLRLVADANAQATNLNEVVVEILAKRLGYTYAPNGRKTEPVQENDFIKLNVPLALDDLIGTAYPRLTKPEAIIRILSSHYGLAIPVPKKQTRRRRAAA